MASEKRIFEISQGTTDLWKIVFRSKNPVGLKIFKTAKNGITKRINDTASILFFTRVREKCQKSPRFEKIACEPSLGAGTERQSQRTKIPGDNWTPFRKRSLCHRGTETCSRSQLLRKPLSSQSTKIPVRGLKLANTATMRPVLLGVRVPKSP